MQGLLKELEQWEVSGDIDLRYFDESGFSQVPNLPYAWTPRGQTLELPAFSHSRRLNVLGFLSRQGRLTCHATTGKVTTETVIAAFEQLLAEKSEERPTIVILDNAAIHRSRRFQEKRRQWAGRELYVIYLPPYSPELNRIEILWRKVKYEWLPMEAYRTFESLCQNVQQGLSDFGEKYQITFV